MCYYILWFSVHYAAAICTDFLCQNVESFTKFAGYLHWEVSFSGTEISLILENNMAAAGLSLKIIYLFLLAGSHK